MSLTDPPRQLRPLESRPPIRCSTNDYLGLSTHPQVIHAIHSAIDTLGWGSTGSRLISGDRTIFHQLESELATWIGKPSALLFNSGYSLNLGVISTLMGPKDIIFADKLVHASIIDGIRISGAKCVRYAHQDLTHLKKLLTTHRHNHENALIVTESIFSMDGDCADIPTLITLKTDFNARLMIDEAHALGVYGQNGEGLSGKTQNQKIDLIVGTFGKSFGGSGAFVACSEETKQTLVQSARSLIYSTAQPPATAAAALAALDLIKPGILGEQLRTKTAWFRQLLTSHNIHALGSTHIVPILAGQNEVAIHWSQTLAQAGFDIPAIRYPTVPRNQARLRVCLSLAQSERELTQLIAILKDTIR